MAYATITSNGLTQCVDSEASGYSTQIYITGFQISDTTNGTANPAWTELPGTTVYEGLSSELTAVNMENGSILYVIKLDQTVGSFTIGTIGLFTNEGVLFAAYSLNVAESKTASNMPSVLGDVRTYFLLVEPLVGTEAINISLNNPAAAPPPYVATAADLPSVGSNISYLYVVGSCGALSGSPPALAYSTGGAWQYIPLNTPAGSYTASDGVALSGNNFSAQVVAEGGILTGSSGLYIDPSFGLVQKWSGSFTGNGSNTSFALTHGLNTLAIVANVADSEYNSLSNELGATYQASSVNQITVKFISAPANGVVFNVTVIG